MAKPISTISDKRSGRLFQRLSSELSSQGFEGRGVILNREVEPGVRHVLEIVGDKKHLSLAIGISFSEVVQFAKNAGSDWYLYVGESRFEAPASIGVCQLIANIGYLAGCNSELLWTANDLHQVEKLNNLVALVRDRALPAFDLVGTRELLLRNWRRCILPPKIELEIQAAQAEGRIPSSEAIAIVNDLASRPGLRFWGSSAITAAIVAAHIGRVAEAERIIEAEIGIYMGKKDAYVKNIKNVASRIGLWPN